MILKLTEEQIKEIRNGKNMVELEGDQSSEIFNQYGAREMYEYIDDAFDEALNEKLDEMFNADGQPIDGKLKAELDRFFGSREGYEEYDRDDFYSAIKLTVEEEDRFSVSLFDQLWSMGELAYIFEYYVSVHIHDFVPEVIERILSEKN